MLSGEDSETSAALSDAACSCGISQPPPCIFTLSVSKNLENLVEVRYIEDACFTAGFCVFIAVSQCFSVLAFPSLSLFSVL